MLPKDRQTRAPDISKGEVFGQITLLAAIGAVIGKNNPAYPFRYKFVDDAFNGLFAGEVQMSRISGIFAAFYALYLMVQGY